MIWLDALKAHDGALDDYVAYLTRRRDQAQQAQDSAPTWEKAQGALEAKRTLDNLLADLKRSEREEVAHGRYARNAHA